MMLLVFGVATGAAQRTKASQSLPKQAPAPTTKTARAIQSLEKPGRLGDLRWPDFSDFAKQVDRFYRASNYSLAWIQNSYVTPRATEMIEVLSGADAEGLNPADYDGPRWDERENRLKSAHSPHDEARFDVALTVCAMRYISAVRIGRIDPKHLEFDIDIRNKKLDLPGFLADLLSPSTDLRGELAKIEPPLDEYKATRVALAKYAELAKQDDGEILPPSIGTVYRGGYYERMPALAKRLRQLGDMPSDADVPQDAISYQEPLISAVKHFQEHHGLTADGNLNPETIEQINVPLRTRAEQLRLAMERFRWLPYTFTQPPIVVNLPEFRLRAFDKDGQVGLSMRVNVGDAYDFQTPVFENMIQYLVFRPYWSVPPRILREEVVPDIEENRDYVRDNNMEVIDRDGNVITSGEVSNAVMRQLRAGALGVREKPGPENALGLLKIIFPNEHHVYLHDTPESRDMFGANSGGALSHGCIHLEQPAALAHWLLRDKLEWTEERVEEAMKSGRDNLTVNLTKPVPILIFYITAFGRPDGDANFFADIYGHDATLSAALAKGYPYP
jgi:L,D-transpeptidase YcbB